jgi:enoyl-CoA hydratase/carnithine racemase
MLRQLAGPQTAAAAVLFGEVLDGETAARCGLVWRATEDADLLADAGAMARRAAEAPPALVRRIKQTLGTVGRLGTREAAVEVELEAQLWSMDQPDFTERVAAMQQRISGRS